VSSLEIDNIFNKLSFVACGCAYNDFNGSISNTRNNQFMN
jgi:hypothetical protein